jgi:hypothetical protein
MNAGDNNDGDLSLSLSALTTSLHQFITFSKMSPVAINTRIALFDRSPVSMGTALLPFKSISPVAPGNQQQQTGDDENL